VLKNQIKMAEAAKRRCVALAGLQQDGKTRFLWLLVRPLVLPKSDADSIDSIVPLGVWLLYVER
jgi:hypothetical protein